VSANFRGDFADGAVWGRVPVGRALDLLVPVPPCDDQVQLAVGRVPRNESGAAQLFHPGGNVVGGHIKVLREHLGLDPARRVGVDAIVVAEVQQTDEGEASTQAAVANLPGTPKFGLDGSDSGHHAAPLRTR